MTETEEDDYKLNSDDSQRSFHISIINNNQISMILTNITTNKRYSSYLSLQSLKKLCKAFVEVQTIKEAIDILKNTIESGNISLAEDPKDSSVSINYDITLPSGHYPDFEVELNLESGQNITFPGPKNYDFIGRNAYMGQVVTLPSKIFDRIDSYSLKLQILISIIGSSYYSQSEKNIKYTISYSSEPKRLNQNRPYTSFISAGDIASFIASIFE